MNEIYVRVAEIAKKYNNIKKIILFGSRARGDHVSVSDIDLAVYADGDISEFCFELDTSVPTLCEFDITKVTKGLDDFFVEQINNDGVIIYERS